MIHRTLNTSILVISLLSVVAFITLPPDVDRYDIRNVNLLILLGGGIHSGLIVLISILLTYKTIKTENEKKTTGLKSFLMLLLTLGTFIMFIFTLLFISPPYEDTVVYKSTTEPLNHIIVQYYETGITGNPHYRITKTDNIESLFRKISLLPDTLINTIYIGERYSNKTIDFFKCNNQIYVLDKYYTLDGQNINR